MLKDAIISSCNKYRYQLTRKWGESDEYVLFVALNPSIADDKIDDSTLKKCIGVSKMFGFDHLKLVNLFAYRDMNPMVMKNQDDPIGSENDKTIKDLAKDAKLIIICWGNDGSYLGRSNEVLEILKPYKSKVRCIGKNKSGQPTHPSRASYPKELQEFEFV